MDKKHLRKTSFMVKQVQNEITSGVKSEIAPAQHEEQSTLEDEVRRMLNDIEPGTTFQLEPKRIFKPDLVKEILKEILDKYLENVKYESVLCEKLSLRLTSEIRNRVKALKFDRYKYVCSVQIIEKKYQGIRSIARYLWDPDFDSYAIYKYTNDTLMAVAYVFAVYHH